MGMPKTVAASSCHKFLHAPQICNLECKFGFKMYNLELIFFYCVFLNILKYNILYFEKYNPEYKNYIV